MYESTIVLSVQNVDSASGTVNSHFNVVSILTASAAADNSNLGTVMGFRGVNFEQAYSNAQSTLPSLSVVLKNDVTPTPFKDASEK